MPSKREIWANWDKAWDLGLTAEQRLAALKEAVAPTFTYTNMDAIVADGKLEQLVQLIEVVLTQQANRLVVKHIGWHEQHGQSALQWDMVDKDTAQTVLPGWSYGRYSEDNGKLLCVSDFYTA